MARLATTLVLVVLLYLVAALSVVLLQYSKTPKIASPTSYTNNATAKDDKQPPPDDTTIVILNGKGASKTVSREQINSPQTHTLPSYVETRSVATKHDDAFSYAQTNNHQRYSTQSESIAERQKMHVHRPATVQPRVNVWNSKWCGLYV